MLEIPLMCIFSLLVKLTFVKEFQKSKRCLSKNCNAKVSITNFMAPNKLTYS